MRINFSVSEIIGAGGELHGLRFRGTEEALVRYAHVDARLFRALPQTRRRSVMVLEGKWLIELRFLRRDLFEVRKYDVPIRPVVVPRVMASDLPSDLRSRVARLLNRVFVSRP